MKKLLAHLFGGASPAGRKLQFRSAGWRGTQLVLDASHTAAGVGGGAGEASEAGLQGQLSELGSQRSVEGRAQSQTQPQAPAAAAAAAGAAAGFMFQSPAEPAAAAGAPAGPAVSAATAATGAPAGPAASAATAEKQPAQVSKLYISLWYWPASM